MLDEVERCWNNTRNISFIFKWTDEPSAQLSKSLLGFKIKYLKKRREKAPNHNREACALLWIFDSSFHHQHTWAPFFIVLMNNKKRNLYSWRGGILECIYKCCDKSRQRDVHDVLSSLTDSTFLFIIIILQHTVKRLTMFPIVQWSAFCERRITFRWQITIFYLPTSQSFNSTRKSRSTPSSMFA